MNVVNSLYPSTEQNLYTITEMVCEVCQKNLKQFQNFKSTYTPEWIQNLLGSAQAASAMPNNHTRLGTLTQMRNDVVDANNNVCTGFASIMKYVENGFAENQVEAAKKIAGNGYYLSAYSRKWESTKTLITMSLDFVNTYSDDLVKGGMPDGFTNAYTGYTDSFLQSLKTFNDYKATVDGETAAKISANNAVYASLLTLLGDGRHIFKNDATMRKSFSYEAFLIKIKKPGKTGYRFKLKEAVTETPVTISTIMVLPTGKSFTANEKGIIFCDLPANNYTYTLTTPGYLPVSGKFMVVTGTTGRETITLHKAVAESAVG